MDNQDPAVQAQGEFAGTLVSDPAASQAIFDLDATLTRSAADLNPTFVVWPENEFADADGPQFRTQLGDLAAETGSTIVADMVWHAPTGMHDTAVTISGLSLVIDPYGRITAEGVINERGVIVGETFTASGQTLYTRWGDWFGWLMVAGLVGLVAISRPRPK